ncbi:hypothetical protein F5Y19DRAFT_469138 [Xylariaceae sp. FL1651]|nr:hypothetical protein F5Y19DRAFT_469138 [Xylariaceae sp. FL1651]
MSPPTQQQTIDQDMVPLQVAISTITKFMESVGIVEGRASQGISQFDHRLLNASCFDAVQRWIDVPGGNQISLLITRDESWARLLPLYIHRRLTSELNGVVHSVFCSHLTTGQLSGKHYNNPETFLAYTVLCMLQSLPPGAVVGELLAREVIAAVIDSESETGCRIEAALYLIGRLVQGMGPSVAFFLEGKIPLSDDLSAVFLDTLLGPNDTNKLWFSFDSHETHPSVYQELYFEQGKLAGRSFYFSLLPTRDSHRRAADLIIRAPTNKPQGLHFTLYEGGANGLGKKFGRLMKKIFK